MMMMMIIKCQFHWWRKQEHPEETTDLVRQVTNKTFSPRHRAYANAMPVPNSGRSSVKPGDPIRHESALAHWATAGPCKFR